MLRRLLACNYRKNQPDSKIYRYSYRIQSNHYRSVDYSTIKNFVFNVTKDIRMCDVATLKQKLQQQYDNLGFKPEEALTDLGLNSFTKSISKHSCSCYRIYRRKYWCCIQLLQLHEYSDKESV